MSPFSHRLLAAALVLGTAAPAAASNYFIADIDIFGPTMLAEFQRFGMEDTEDVLQALLTPSDRASIAFATGLTEGDLADTARLCDLMQIIGVGPRAARLLVGAGIMDTADLASRVATELLPQVEQANAVGRFTGVNPTAEDLQEWITQAASVPMHPVW